MKKLIFTVFLLLSLFSIAYSGDKDKYKQSDRAREKYMRKVERRNKKRQDAFYGKQYSKETRKGKHGHHLGKS
jgi:hypothetical protein